jgi:hypothetical protein
VSRRVAVALGMCLLVLVASGDDINLLRVAVPSASAAAPMGSLPLDDGNTDFLESKEGRDQRADLARAVDTLTATPWTRAAVCSGFPRSCLPSPARSSTPSLTPFPTPLRC